MIRCDKQEIDIVSAFFGRTDRKVCQSGLDWLGAWAWNVNCHAGNALEVTRGECQGLSSCELNANTAEYGEPCFGTKKYLKESYPLLLINYFIRVWRRWSRVTGRIVGNSYGLNTRAFLSY